MVFVCGLFWASAAWWLSSRGEHPKRAQWKGGRFHDLVKWQSLPSTPPVKAITKDYSSPKRGAPRRVHSMGGVSGSQGHIARRPCVMRDTVVAIFGKNLLQ